MNSDLFSKSPNDGEIYVIAPALRLQLMKLSPRQREKIVNCLINEAIAARELIRLTPDGTGSIGLSVKTEVSDDIAAIYGEAVLNTNDAFQGTGNSYEMLRD